MKRVTLVSLCALIISLHLHGQGMMQQLSASGAPPPGVSSWMPAHTSPTVNMPKGGANSQAARQSDIATPVVNYQRFTLPTKKITPEVVTANAGYEKHPELGMLYSGAPCSNCYELISQRTETTKTFVEIGSKNGKKEMMTQTSTQPMHYRDAEGNWRTIRTQLLPDESARGVYAVKEEATPLYINTNKSGTFSSLGKEGEGIKFNRNLELIFVTADGKEQSLGTADWTHHTAGDQGVYVTNAWPGIDIELNIMRAAIKTNFHINKPMPQYADGKLLLRDHMELANGLTLGAADNSKVTGELMIKNTSGETKYGIGIATVYEKNDYQNTIKPLAYLIGKHNALDIELPGAYLNKPATSYPVIIDPLVSLATSIPVAGSSYNATWAPSSGCLYTNPAWTPPNCTITAIEFAFQYTTNSPCSLNEGAMSFYLGTCRSPTPVASSWSCASPLAGTCTATGGATYDIYSSLGSCLPPPSCPSIALNIKMYLYQSHASTPACVTTWVYGSQPLVFTIRGHTVEVNSISASPSTICLGASSTLSASGVYGVGPYTYSWAPGPLSGSSVVVSPTSTTVYTLTITDVCGITATSTTTVTVNNVAPITGTFVLCVGNTTALADATSGAHTWTSSNPGVATITSGTGIVTAIAPGTTTITFTITGTGCFATAVVTVIPLPAAITGIATLCVGGTTTLADATAGGSWWSGATGIATVGSGTGIVTGIAPGTATITYGSTGCYVTKVVTVNLLGPITGTLTICQGGTTTLSNAAGAGTWASGSTSVATITSPGGVVTGVSGGTSVITYTSAAGCSTTAIVTVNPIAPISGTLTLCVGSTTTLTNPVAGGTWSSVTTAVATITSSGGVVTAISPGTTTIIYTVAGCTTSVVVTVNLLAPITGTTTICTGASTTLADAATGGIWSSTNTGVATIGAASGIVSGIAGGTTTISYLLPSGCSAVTTLTVITVAPITGTPIVCQGSTTALSDATPGGTWLSGSAAIATVSGTGIVTGVLAGTSVITYTASSAACMSMITVTVNPLPAAITGTTNVCAGLTTALSDATPGGAWISSNTGIAAITTAGIITGVSAGSVTITYKLPTGCLVTIPVVVNPLPAAIAGPATVCLGSSVNLTDASAGGTWISSNTAVATINIATGAAAGVSVGTTTITYTLTTGCLITRPLSVMPLPAAPATVNIDYCQNATAAPLTAAGTNLLWYTVPTGGVGSPVTPTPSTVTTGVTTWYVSQTVTGCESPLAAIQITVHIHPDFNIIPSKDYVCQYDTISFTYSGPSFPGITYTWALPTYGHLAAGSSLFNPAIVMSYDTSIGNNYITLTVGDGYAPCNVTQTLPVTVYLNSPNVGFYVKPDICVGEEVPVALTYIGPGITDYLWDFDGADIITASSNHGGPYLVSWSAAGIHTVTLNAISNVKCTSRPIIDTINVHDYPIAKIESMTQLNSKSNELCTGDSVLLAAKYFQANNIYTWTPAHFFEAGSGERIIGTVGARGYINLTVTDPFGCAARDSIYCDAQPCCAIAFPSAFTPNGDGKNDVFRPVTLGNHRLHSFRIVNRWGQTIFETVDEGQAWDGTFNGVPQDMDVYYYYFKYDCYGKTMLEKGEVTLVR